VWYVLIFFLLALWVAYDARKRKLGVAKIVLWAIGTFVIGVVVMAFYIAHRPLKANEFREGGYAWNVVKGFALSWTIFVIAVVGVAISGIGDALTAVVALILLGGGWLGVMIVALIVGFFLRNPAIVERGPTGPLAQESRVV
jgi:hypothetical protein